MDKVNQYKREHYSRQVLELRVDRDCDLIEFLSSCDNKSETLKIALREYMARRIK